MKIRNTQTTTCTESLKLLADFWILRIIEVLASDNLRYCGIQREVDNLNPATLTNKLNKLEEAGLVKRTETMENGAVTYSLTAQGRKALPVLKAIKDFSR